MAINSDIDKQIKMVDGEITPEQAREPDYEPIYQVYGAKKIPVSKSAGTLWKMRKEECKKRLTTLGTCDRWEEAIAYYQDDQGGQTRKTKDLDKVETPTKSKRYASENVVFENISALVPAIYAKNPETSVTSPKSSQEKRAKLFEKLLDELYSRKIEPCVNLKAKMRRITVTTMLTNIGYAEIEYVRKEDSSEAAMEEINKLSTALVDAKNVTELKEIEAKLCAIDERITLLSPAGPHMYVRDPRLILIDPDSEEADLSDAKYIIIGKYVNTDYLRTVYGTKDEHGEWKSIYQPTHILSATDQRDISGHDYEINHFTLLDDNSEHSKYGYDNEEEFRAGCRTLVWTVWDKATRRVLMFNSKDWSWPIWVWDDPYQLSRFYPLYELTFYTDPENRYGKSEVMYYLDQQDEINRINHERAKMRHWAMTKIFFDKNSVENINDVENFLNGTTKTTVFGVDLAEGKTVQGLLGTLALPSTQFEQLFDSKAQLESIARLSSVSPIMQNVQFKTNTTNKAIESYESSAQTRLDEKIDAIEEFLGDVGQGILELCIQFMPPDVVTDILGEEFVADKGGWQNMQVKEFNREYSLRIIGGSTLKPTAKVKKEQAMQMGQVLGQFAAASPVVVVVMLKMMQRAFGDDVVISEEEWNLLIQSLTGQIAAQSAPPGGGQPAEGNKPSADDGADINAVMGKVEKLIEQMPPEMKAKLGEGIKQGIPLKDLVATLLGEANKQPQSPPSAEGGQPIPGAQNNG